MNKKQIGQLKANGYKSDSLWEESLRTGLFKNLEYHPQKIAYTIEHTYEPDWVIYLNDIAESKIYIEAKGAFRDSAELQKYTNIKDQLDMNEELVFLFQRPNAPIYFKAKRKDGSRMTHAEWAEKNGFRYFDENTIKELLNDRH